MRLVKEQEEEQVDEDQSSDAPILVEDSDSLMEDAEIPEDKKSFDGSSSSASENGDDVPMEGEKDKLDASDEDHEISVSSEDEDSPKPQISESDTDLSSLSKEDRQAVLDLVPDDVEGEEEKFYISLYKWLLQHQRKKLPPKTPIMGYKYLDLYVMYKEVTHYGGFKNFNSVWQIFFFQ